MKTWVFLTGIAALIVAICACTWILYQETEALRSDVIQVQIEITKVGLDIGSDLDAITHH
jgi:hypothetical protein